MSAWKCGWFSPKTITYVAGAPVTSVTRTAPEAARRVVTVSPDVSSSTNLGGWVNKVGVWSPTERVDYVYGTARGSDAVAGLAAELLGAIRGDVTARDAGVDA